MQTAQRTSDDIALGVAEYGLGGVLLSRTPRPTVTAGWN